MQKEIWENNKEWKVYPKDHTRKISIKGKVKRLLSNGTWKEVKGNNNRTDGSGYIQIRINGKLENLNRIVYETWKGNIKKYMVIHHEDDNKLNNAINNLKQKTQSENTALSRTKISGYANVYKNRNKWRILIRHRLWEYKSKHFGQYDTPEEANKYAKLIQEIIKKPEEEIKEIINLIIKENEKRDTTRN